MEAKNKMELKVSLHTQEEIERFILIVNLGLTAALKMDMISINEAERHLYTPYSFTILEELGINEDVVMLVKLGCELEDVESILPDKLDNSINTIHNSALDLLRTIPKPSMPSKLWIDE